MATPLVITFRGMNPSPALAIAIRTWLARLEHDHDRILRCAVVVEQPHHHHGRGNAFHVHVTLSIPGGDIAVSHDADGDASHDDPYIVLGDAFRSARRQLRDYVDARRDRMRA